SYLDNYIDADTHYNKGYDSVMDMPIQVLSFASGGDTYSIIRVNKGVPHAFKVNSLIILSPEITTTLNKRQVFKPLNKDTLLYVDTSTIVTNKPSFNLCIPNIYNTSIQDEYKVNTIIIISQEITTTVKKSQIFKPPNKDTLLYVETITIIPNNPSYNLSKPIIAKTSLNEVGY